MMILLLFLLIFYSRSRFVFVQHIKTGPKQFIFLYSSWIDMILLLYLQSLAIFSPYPDQDAIKNIYFEHFAVPFTVSQAQEN